MRYSPTLFAVALFLFLFPCAVHVTRGADKPALEGPGKVTPDGKGIERLVKQLGSDEFKEREAASSALRKVGKAALIRRSSETWPSLVWGTLKSTRRNSRRPSRSRSRIDFIGPVE